MDSRKPPITFLSKPASHFKPISDYERGEHYQFLAKIQKLPKSGSSSDRNETEWYITSNNYTFPEYEDRLVQIQKVAGELFRFLDFLNPKYRGYELEDTEFIASKEADVVGDYRSVKQKEEKFVCREGLAKNYFYKYFYLDSDAHLGNVLVGKDQCVRSIDHNQCFDPVTGKMTDTPRKEEKYRKLPKQSRSDYETFPWVESYVPMSWGWVPEKRDEETEDAYQRRLSEAKKEVLEVAKDPRIINEKHFAALQLAITQELQFKFFVNRIQNPEDRDDLTRMLESQFKEFSAILGQSTSFYQYLQTKRLDAFLIISYEVHKFLKDNKYYENATQVSIKELQEIAMKSILQQYQQVLKTANQPPLSGDELRQLHEFVKNIETTDSLMRVEKCYSAHDMYRRADLAREDALKNELVHFFSKWPNNKEQLNTFIKERLPFFATDKLDPFQFMLEFLIEKRQKIVGDIFIIMKECKGLSPTQLSRIVLYAAIAQQAGMAKLVDMAKSLMKEHPNLDLNICRPRNQNYVLHFLIDEEKPDFDAIRYLCEEAKPPVALNIKNKKNISPFMLAVERKHKKLIDYFINTPTLRCQLTPEEVIKAALFYVSEKQYDQANVLLDQNNLNEIRKVAASWSLTDVNIMQYLCENYFPSRNADAMPECFIVHAMQNKQWDLVRYCLKKFPKVDLTKEVEGQTYLSLAVLRKRYEFIDPVIKDPAELERFKPELRKVFPVLTERAVAIADKVMLNNLLKIARELIAESAISTKDKLFKDGLTRWIDKIVSSLHAPKISTSHYLVRERKI